MSKKELDRLGDRLRDSAVPSAEDLRLLEMVRPHYLAALDQTVTTLTRLFGSPIGHREKNRETILEKLRREKDMRLSRVQDVVGARVVRSISLPEQDEIVASIAAEFPDHRSRDRRKEPSFGYRAVHLIARLDGIPVEVQVRTTLQHGWAQSMERLGDKWGRQIRYGGQPYEPDRLHAFIPDHAGVSRQTLVSALLDLSPWISRDEEQQTGSQFEVPGLPGTWTCQSLLDCFLRAKL